MCGGKIIKTSGHRYNNEGKIIATKLLCEKGCRPSFASICDKYPEWEIELLLDHFAKVGDLKSAIIELQRMRTVSAISQLDVSKKHITYREAGRIVKYCAQLLAHFEGNYEPAKVTFGSTLYVDEEYNYMWESKEEKDARKERNNNRRRGRENRPNYWPVNLETDNRYWLSCFPITQRSSVELDAAISPGLRICKDYVGKTIVCDDLAAYRSVILSHRMIPDQESKDDHFGHNSTMERLNETTRAYGLRKWRTFRTHGYLLNLVVLIRFDYNYFKPHQFLLGKTPAEVATMVRVKNWIELIRLAEIVTPVPYEKRRKGYVSPVDGSIVPLDVNHEINDALARQSAFKDRNYFSP